VLAVLRPRTLDKAFYKHAVMMIREMRYDQCNACLDPVGKAVNWYGAPSGLSLIKDPDMRASSEFRKSAQLQPLPLFLVGRRVQKTPNFK